MDWKTATTAEALAAWDAGEPVWSCEMGGLGPGYEQAIHMMAFEMLRAMEEHPPEDWAALSGEEGRDKWFAYRDEIETLPAVFAAVERIGPSGAQFCAAMNIASVFARRGYAEGMEMVPPERRILVSRNFPSVEP